MNFDKVFYKAISEKFKFNENDYDFSSDGGWIDYYATDNVPKVVVNPLDPEDQESENLSSITIEISDVDISLNPYESTMVPYGETYVELEPAGWEIDKVDSYNSVKFMWDGTEITREQYRDLNKMTDDEVKASEGILEVEAIEKFNLFLDENYEPPETDYYYEPDYDDWR